MTEILERDILIWLNSIGLSNKNIDILNEYFSDFRELLYVNADNLRRLRTMKEKDINTIIENRNIEKINGLSIKLKEAKIMTKTVVDDDYPKSLIHIYDKPYVIYQKGQILEKDKIAIGIVGARKSTPYGKWACEKFVKELVQMDVTIVSGLALGIDAVAHKTAIDNGGRTIAVLGNGLDQIYPKKNSYLYNTIENNGAILTEFPLGTLPLPYNFPQRNRIIAGLSLGIIVIEAKEKSGSLITAHHGLEQGKDIFALPGNINSIYSGGTNKLIKDGARPLLDIEDLIEEISALQENLIKSKKETIEYENLSITEQKIVKAVEEGPIHCDLISSKTGIQISTVISTLTILEMKGIIKEYSNQIFTLN